MIGIAADAAFGDPRRGHPVAAFGRAATALEGPLYGDSRLRGILFVLSCTVPPVALARQAERWAADGGRAAAAGQVFTTALATWAVLGGRSLHHEGVVMAEHLEVAELDWVHLDAARRRLRNLCARDATTMSGAGLARATVESLAENTSDAVVAPLLWGAVAGVPGLVGYRAVNTLDAMVGYRSERYERFGWAAARLDDLVNLVPARVTGLLTVVCAPIVGGSPWAAWRVLRRDAGRHPSPNAGRPEAAVAGALGLRLGGRNVYDGYVEVRPRMGDGHSPTIGDVYRAARLTRTVGYVAGALAALLALMLGRLRRPR